MIFEHRGKLIGVRVLSSDAAGPKVEATTQGNSKLLGQEVNDLWTYWSVIRPDGTMYGEAQGVITTKDGLVITAVSQGVGKPTGPGGAASWRGTTYMYSSSQQFKRLNGVAGAFEYEADSNGNTTGKVWEWK
jgi:hypothetical protein